MGGLATPAHNANICLLAPVHPMTPATCYVPLYSYLMSAKKVSLYLIFFSFVIASFLSFVSCYLSTFKASNKKLISESPLHHVISLVHFHPGPVASKSVNFFVENGLWSLPLLRTNWRTLFVAGIAQSRSTEYWLIPHRVRCYFTVFVGPTLPNRVFT